MYARQPSKTYKVILGGNVFQNCQNVVNWEGKEVIMQFRDGGDMKLLADCAVKDKDNNTIAKIANNKLQCAAKFLDFQSVDNGIILKDKSSDTTYLEFRQLGEREVKINGIFYINGIRIEAKDDGLIIGKGVKLRNNTFDGLGKGLILSPNMFAIGGSK